MKRPIVILVIVVFCYAAIAIVSLLTKRSSPASPSSPTGSIESDDTVEYQGQQIKLSKRYDDYDDYKNDPDNLAANEVPKVQKLVQTTPVAKQFKDREAMIDAIDAIGFPGYGSTSCGELPQPDGSVLALNSIEIPKADKDRWFLFRGRGGVYTLIDDFICSQDAAIMGVKIDGDKLVYTRLDGSKAIERTPTVP